MAKPPVSAWANCRRVSGMEALVLSVVAVAVRPVLIPVMIDPFLPGVMLHALHSTHDARTSEATFRVKNTRAAGFHRKV